MAFWILAPPGAHSVSRLPEAPLSALHPIPTHDIVLGFMKKMQGCLRLRPFRVHRRAAQEVADHSDESPQRLRKGQGGVQGCTASLRLSTNDDPVVSPSKLPSLTSDQAVECALDGTQGLPVEAILFPATMIGDVVIPRLELHQPPTYSGLTATLLHLSAVFPYFTPPLIEAAHFTARRSWKKDFHRDVPVQEKMWPVCVVPGGFAQTV
mmetsp:Transcript_2524/g.5808  ORF Transcript_2524/g.5808 Transcript_2524/m.5808 type:complete len:209 (+) Transcript_2524:248-874(+)